MTRRFTVLAWTAAACTYLLIILGAIVRITGSGMGCGDHWPLCNGRLLPPLDDIGTVIEWSHRLVAALVSVLVVAVAAYAALLQRAATSRYPGLAPGVRKPSRAPFMAAGLLVVQVLLGAITVKLELPPWSVILHLGTAMLLLGALLAVAREHPVHPSPILVLAFSTVLFGALTANLGAAAACAGFPLCSGQIWPAGSGGSLPYVHWIHRLLAYALSALVLVTALRSRRRAMWGMGVLVLVQVAIGAATVLLGLPPALQAAHLAVGTAVWAGAVWAAPLSEKSEAPAV